MILTIATQANITTAIPILRWKQIKYHPQSVFKIKKEITK